MNDGQAHGNNDLPIEVSTSGTSRDALYAHCPPCNRTWLALKLPCEVGLAGKLMKSVFCAKCHEKKQIVMASDEQINTTTLH